MMTKKEALEEMDRFINMNRKNGRCDIEPEDVGFILQQIYDSIGTCIQCEKYIDKSCIIPKLEYRYERANTFYCADYKKDK